MPRSILAENQSSTLEKTEGFPCLAAAINSSQQISEIYEQLSKPVKEALQNSHEKFTFKAVTKTFLLQQFSRFFPSKQLAMCIKYRMT